MYLVVFGYISLYLYILLDILHYKKLPIFDAVACEQVVCTFYRYHPVHSTLERRHVPSYSQNTPKNRENPA